MEYPEDILDGEGNVVARAPLTGAVIVDMAAVVSDPAPPNSALRELYERGKALRAGALINGEWTEVNVVIDPIADWQSRRQAKAERVAGETVPEVQAMRSGKVETKPEAMQGDLPTLPPTALRGHG